MPWNAPLMLSTWRIAPALAAGNTVVLKPAEWSPLDVDAVWRSCSEEAGLPAGVFNIVQGFGETAGAALSRHPGVDLICFTGETTTGSTILAAGAPTLKRSSVELGGKSPVVVFDDADPRAVRRRCACPDLHDERTALHGGFSVARTGGSVRGNRGGRRGAGATRQGRGSVRSEHRARAVDPPRAPRARARLHRSAREQGARVLAGGGRPSALPNGNFLEATVIADVTEECGYSARRYSARCSSRCRSPTRMTLSPCECDGLRAGCVRLDE